MLARDHLLHAGVGRDAARRVRRQRRPIDQRGLGELEEVQVGGGVVEHRRQAAGGKVILRRLDEAELAAVPFEVVQRRHHGHEDAEEQERHLLDRAKREMVFLMDDGRGEIVGRRRRREHHELPQEEGLGQEDRPDDHEQEQDVDAALEPPSVVLLNLRLDGAGGVPEAAAVKHVEHHENRPDRGRPFLDDMVEQPEKRHAAKVAEKQWRIADGGERPAAVGHDEDEEDHVKRADADLVHADPRPDQHHRRARRADKIGRHRADGQKHHVLQRRGLALHLEVDAAGHDKQRADEADEREILVQGVRHHRAAAGQLHQVDRHHQQAQADGDVGIIMLPNVLRPRRRQRHDRDQHQQQPERHDEGGRNVGPETGGKRRQQRHDGVDARVMPTHVNAPQSLRHRPWRRRRPSGPLFSTAEAAGDLLEPTRDHLVGVVALGLQVAVGTKDFEVRDGMQVVLLGDGRVPVDALHAGPVDVHFHHGDVAAVRMQLLQLRGNGAARRAILAVEIEDHRFSRHQVVRQVHGLALGNVNGLGALHVGVLGAGGEQTGAEHGKSERDDEMTAWHVFLLRVEGD